MRLKSESEGKLGNPAEEEKVKESVGKKEKVGQVGRGQEKEESEDRGEQAQVLHSQELLMRRRGSGGDHRPMDQMSLPDPPDQKENKEDKENKENKENKEEKGEGKSKQWTWSEKSIGSGNNRQKQEEPSLLAILRLLSPISKSNNNVLREYRLASSENIFQLSRSLMLFCLLALLTLGQSLYYLTET